VSPRASAAAFAVSFLVAGIGFSVLLWTYDRSNYAAFASEARLDERTFHGRNGPTRATLREITVTDDEVRQLVLREPLIDLSPPIPLNEREVSHLEDVRAIYDVLKPLSVAAAVSLIISSLRVEWRVRRRIALALAAGILGLGALAAVAFDPLFLLFHRVFFPQGNFLFDPAQDNLVLLYPESYWLGVTLRVGATFVMMTLAIAALASLPVRSPAGARQWKEGSRA
jgi:integral membrane protein (TIGR01906 family)